MNTPHLTPCILESPYAAPKELRDAWAEARRVAGYREDALTRLAENAVRAAEAMHLRYLRALAKYAFGLGYAPFASHALYTQWLDDHDPEERALGMQAGFVLADALHRAALGMTFGKDQGLVVLVGVDLGVSTGMELGIKLHMQHGRDVREVFLGKDWGRKIPRLGPAARGTGDVK